MKKRRDLSIKEKVAILESYDKLPKMGQREAAAKLQISQPLLCKILKNRISLEMDIEENQNILCKRRRTGKNAEVESALKLWFTNVREDDARVNGPLMRQKAENLTKQIINTNLWQLMVGFNDGRNGKTLFTNMYKGNRTVQMPQQQHHTMAKNNCGLFF